MGLLTFSENRPKQALLAHKGSEQPGWKGTVLPLIGSLRAPPAPHPPRLCLTGVTPLRGSACQVEAGSDFCHTATFHTRTSVDKELLPLKEAEAGARLVSCHYITTSQKDRQAKCLNHQIQQADSSLQ